MLAQEVAALDGAGEGIVAVEVYARRKLAVDGMGVGQELGECLWGVCGG